MRTFFCLLLALCSLVRLARAQAAMDLMPMPSSVEQEMGFLTIDPSFSVSVSGAKDVRIQHAVARFLDHLRHQTGITLLQMEVSRSPVATLAIHADHASKEFPQLGEDESYTLEISDSGAKLSAPNTLGVLHGLQTFLQLVQNTADGFAVPAVTIHDQPRFPWRGLMIDVCRHFMPVAVIKRNLDGMEAVKLNVFHWHLSDNQGFRVESKVFPKLQELGSDGLFYTQAEIREVIEYAAERGIRVVPEFDMPGHSTSWFVGYPYLASAPGPYQIERRWGVFDPAMDPTQDRTYKFLDEFIGGMAHLFPDAYFHIGGDEVNGKQWDANARIHVFMKLHKLENNTELQAYFNKRVQPIVSRHGKIMMGWDEILNPDLPKNIVIQSWRGQESLAEAALQGYSGLLSSGYYLDLNQPAVQHYEVDPMSGQASELAPEDAKRILGGEACIWSEYVSAENIDSRIWPRTAAIAERLWSPQELIDADSMYRRLDATSRRLELLGLTHNAIYADMLRRIAGSDNIAPLRTVADVVEPVKGYARESLAATEPTSLTPLNRLVDAARPESMPAEHFTKLVDDYLAGNGTPDSEAEIKSLLTQWRDCPVDLQDLADKSSLLQEVMPVASDLSALGIAGLQALDYLDKSEPAPDEWRTTQLARIEQAETPGPAQVQIMVATPVQKLVEATSVAAPASPAAQ